MIEKIDIPPVPVERFDVQLVKKLNEIIDAVNSLEEGFAALDKDLDDLEFTLGG